MVYPLVYPWRANMTRYPKDGRGVESGRWTIQELDAISSDWQGDRICDANGLLGEVRVSSLSNVTIAFKYGFKWEGKKVWFYCGTYPKTSIKKIRGNRNAASESLKNGIDPRLAKKIDKIKAREKQEADIEEQKLREADNLTFAEMYQAWIRDGVSRADGNAYIMQSFNKHALPELGNIKVRHVTEHHLRNVYRSIIDAGKVATAVELSKDIGQMMRWAEKRKPWRVLLVDGNPSELVEIKYLIPKDYTKERKRILSIDEIKKLKSIFDSTAEIYEAAPKKYGVERPLKKEVQLAMWICLGTLCRIGELLMAEWRHVNFTERTWFIPSANVKGEAGDKHDQIVYLSDFVLDKFQQLQILTGDSNWMFPARYKDGHVDIKSASKLIGDRQIKFKKRNKKLDFRVENNSLVLNEDEEWTPHDLRRTGATMMQKLKPRVSRDVINLCQNHVIGTKVDRVYLLDDYADEKRDAWYRLGSRIDLILSGEFKFETNSNVIPFRSHRHNVISY